ncbi:MAG: hypothetical protein U5K54_12675 [Cytophagales bacterium]|nr:hypothetical protein [Cytophagales bacterium]
MRKRPSQKKPSKPTSSGKAKKKEKVKDDEEPKAFGVGDEIEFDL